MIALGSKDYLTPEEYLEFEKTSDIRHEYIDGEVFAMAGASNAHNRINTNFLIALSSKLKGTTCQTYTNDMKVRAAEGRRYFYPDLLVSCSEETNDLSTYYMNHPCLIIEVLSNSTEAFDRGEKFQYYREIPSLQEYILVSSRQYYVDCFRRGENNFWVLQSYQGLEATLQLKSLHLEVSLADIYESIVFERSPETETIE